MQTFIKCSLTDEMDLGQLLAWFGEWSPTVDDQGDAFRLGSDIYQRDTRHLMAEMVFLLSVEGLGHVAEACGERIPKGFAWQVSNAGIFGSRRTRVAKELDRRGLDPILDFSRAMDAAGKAKRPNVQKEQCKPAGVAL